MFHFQQSAEKFLKALISNHKIRIQKTHDISVLINLCKSNNIELINDIDILEQLNEYAIEGRYAIIHDDIEDTNSFTQKLEELKKFIENIIK